MENLLIIKPVSLILTFWTFGMLLFIFINEIKPYKIYKYIIAGFSLWTFGVATLIFLLIGLSSYIQIDKLLDVRIVPDEDIDSTVYTLIPSIVTLLSFMIISISGAWYVINTEKVVKRLERTSYVIFVTATIAIIGHCVNIHMLYYKLTEGGSGMAFHMATIFLFMSIILYLIAKFIYKNKYERG